MQEFIINDFLTVKLETGNTIIYINGKFFNQCKYLLLNIPVDKIRLFDDITSIDEASERLNHLLDGKPDISSKRDISPEEEFWAHCSNLQAWTEHNYDTRLLHSNLSFPLLRKLTEVDDPIARRVFKDEIFKKIKSGNKNIIEYLKEQGYLKYLSKEELSSLEEFIYEFEYTLSVFWKQGDDLRDFLEMTDGDSKKALIAWGKNFQFQASRLRKLVEIFKGKSLKVVNASDHSIIIEGYKEILEKAVVEGLVNKHKLDYN